MRYLNSQTLAAAGWISVFGLSWLMLLDIVPITGLSIVLFMFYLVVGLFASTYYAAQADKKSKLQELYKMISSTKDDESEGEEGK